jgi:hypothetical protein
MKLILTLLISTLIISSIQVQGQSTDEKPNAVAAVESKVVGPMLPSGVGGTVPAVSFQFSKDTTTATAQIGGRMGETSRWGLTVGGPLSKSSSTTTLATSEGLNTGVNAELVFRQIFLGDRVEMSRLEFTRLCIDYLLPEWRAQKPNPCERKQLTPEGQRILDAKAFPPTWTIGGSAKIGRKSFDFTTPTLFSDQSETHNGSSFSVAGGVFLNGSLFYYLGGSVRHETAFVAGASQNICTPIGNSTSTFCRDIAVGAPARRDSNLLQLEMRNFLGGSLALAPRVTYETEKRAWSIEAPIYLRQGDGPFNGGVNLGWDSKQHQVVVSLFVGMLPKLFQ